MNDLKSVLQSVSEGQMTTEKAKEWIERTYLNKKTSDAEAQSPQSPFEKLKKSVGFDEFFKISTQFVQQLSETIPGMSKLQENLSTPLGFCAKVTGVESKLSIFRNIQVSADSSVADNLLTGSQWSAVQFSENAEVKENKFMVVQFSDVAVVRSDLCRSNLTLTRFNQTSLQEARFEFNKFTRCTMNNVNIKESDFTQNTLTKCDLSHVQIHSTRLSKLMLENTKIHGCEFTSCDIQGIEFENCEWQDCSFQRLKLVAPSGFKISNQKLVGMKLSNCQTIEEFLAAVDKH